MNFFALTGLLNTVVSTFLGIYVLIQNSHDSRHRTYAAYCLSLSFWSGFYFLWLISESATQAILFARLLMVGAIFIPIMHYHHIATLFGPPKHHAKLIASGYTLSVFFLLFNFTPFFIRGTHPTPVTPYWPTPGSVFPLYLVYFLFYVGISIYLLNQRRKQATGIRRTQMEYILLGTIIGYLGGSTNFPLWYNVSLLPYGNVLVPVFLSMIAYILIHHRLLDVQTIFKKGLTYGLTLSLILLPLFVASLFAQRHFFGSISYPFSGFLLMTFVVIALAFYHLKRKIETAVSRSFFNSSYETVQSLKALSQAVIQMLDLKEIGRKLTVAIATATGAKSSALFVQDASGYFRPIAAYPDEAWLPRNGGVSEEHPLCQVLKSQAIVLREEVPSLWPKDQVASVQQFFAAHDFELLIAFLAPSEEGESRLVGFCGLAEKKQSQQPYQAEELKYLESLSTQAAIAMENARLHQFHLEAQKQLERVNRLQGIEDVVTGLSHEIRNPLTSIKMFLQLLPQIKHQEEFVSKYYQAAIREMARIERLITELMALSKPKAPRLRKQSLNNIIESVKVLLEPKCRGRSIALETDLEATLPHIPLDEDKIRQVLLNLLLNAVEAVGEDGRITVNTRLVLSGGIPFVRLTITDTGRGIPPEHLERIFTPFYSTKEKSTSQEGRGLGLTIVHRLVQEHSGTIHVESTPGKQTTFIIMLPVQTPSPVPERSPTMDS